LDMQSFPLLMYRYGALLHLMTLEIKLYLIIVLADKHYTLQEQNGKKEHHI
jgi:hypothetical protein